MFNPQRGEAAVTIAGAAHRLRFTLGALAEIESVFDTPEPAALGGRLKALSARDLQAVLAALLRAGGAAEADALAADADPRLAAQAVAACLKSNLA